MDLSKTLAPWFIPMFALFGCAPDLAVTDLGVTWNAAEKKAVAEISNLGNQGAEEFLVYFNGDESPVSQNHRPQVRHTVASLSAGASITLEADFDPLAHPDNAGLAKVYQVSVLVDAKGMVQESNEDNNVRRALTVTPTVELYDKNNVLVPANPVPLSQPRIPVLFVHGHNLLSATDQDFNYRKNWQDPLFLTLPSFKIALDLPQNAGLDIEPYYIRFQDQHRSVVEGALEIHEAVERILRRHNDPQATQVKVVIVAYSKGTISTRWYLKNLLPTSRPVSEFIAIAPPNHGLSAGSAQTASSLAFRQLNNGYDDACNSFSEIESENFIERLNGHPIEDSQTNSVQDLQYAGEAPGSRSNGTPVDQGILYVTLYANDNRDAVGGGTPSGDCQGRLLAKNMAPDVENIEVSEIFGSNPLLVHANTVHTPGVICLALYTAVHHQAPNGVSCTTTDVDGRDVPIIPLP